MCVCVHKWNWVIDGKNVNYSAVGKRLLDKYLNIHWNQKTTKISRDIISNSDKSIYAVVHWATLPKWNVDKKKKDQRMLSRTEQELGIARERWLVWQKGFGEREKQCKKWTSGGKQKVISVMLPVFNTDQKIPQHSHLPDFIKQSRGEGWEINLNSLIILLKHSRRPKSVFHVSRTCTTLLKH